MRKIGYVRVSSDDQNPKRQLEQLETIGMDRMYQEMGSGVKWDRPQLQQMMQHLEKGDTIYVTDLTRITRSTRDLFILVDAIKMKQAYLHSIKDTWLDLSDDNPYLHFLMTVIGGVNQLERDLLQMRQQEGIYLAKQEGKYTGRMRTYHVEHGGMIEAQRLYEEGRKTVQQICKQTGVSRSALYRWLKQSTAMR